VRFYGEQNGIPTSFVGASGVIVAPLRFPFPPADARPALRPFKTDCQLQATERRVRPRELQTQPEHGVREQSVGNPGASCT
jgi:hypothetical protein